jgi:hypothetical protein
LYSSRIFFCIFERNRSESFERMKARIDRV